MVGIKERVVSGGRETRILLSYREDRTALTRPNPRTPAPVKSINVATPQLGFSPKLNPISALGVRLYRLLHAETTSCGLQQHRKTHPQQHTVMHCRGEWTLSAPNCSRAYSTRGEPLTLRLMSMLGKVDGMKAANNDQAIELRGEIEARLGLKAKVVRTETWSRTRRRLGVQRGEVVLLRDVEGSHRCSF